MKLAGDQYLFHKKYRKKIFEQIVTVAYLKKQPPEVLKIFTNFTGKHQNWSFSLIKLQD